MDRGQFKIIKRWRSGSSSTVLCPRLGAAPPAGCSNAFQPKVIGAPTTASSAMSEPGLPVPRRPSEPRLLSDWSYEHVVLGGVTQTIKQAHFRLTYSRQMFVVACPRIGCSTNGHSCTVRMHVGAQVRVHLRRDGYKYGSIIFHSCRILAITDHDNFGSNV